MNIFATSRWEKTAARDLDDKRVIKMVLETAQMLSTCMMEAGRDDAPYRPTHANHPCTVWVRKCGGNYAWAWTYFRELCREYTHRYGKTHKCEQHLKLFLDAHKEFPVGAMTPFAECHGVEHAVDVHEGYRECLRRKWQSDKREPRWTNRERPPWA